MGRAHAPAVRQAARVATPGDAPGADRQVDPVLHVAVWVGMGFATLMEWLTESLEAREPDPARRWLLATPVLLLALVPLVGNRLTASRKGETLARDFAYDMLQSVEPYGVLVTAGDNDTFPLWYAQEVEHIRQDVTVVNLSLANTDWYLRQLQRRPLATFDSTAAPSIYRARAWPKPAGRLLDYTDEQLAHLEPVYWLDQKRLVNLGGVSVSLDPQQPGRRNRSSPPTASCIRRWRRCCGSASRIWRPRRWWWPTRSLRTRATGSIRRASASHGPVTSQ